MAYWLMKCEPFLYSYDDLVRDGKYVWDGVRNYAARNNLMAMKKDDEALYYHSNEGLACVGIMTIIKEHEPDVTVEPEKLTKDGKNPWVVVTVAPVAKLKQEVTLKAIKANPKLKDMELLTTARLSVQKVTEGEWKILLAMGGGLI